jgi:hypothetical protein
VVRVVFGWVGGGCFGGVVLVVFVGQRLISKFEGGERKFGIPIVLVGFVLQAVVQVLTFFEGVFSDLCFGFWVGGVFIRWLSVCGNIVRWVIGGLLMLMLLCFLMW